MIDFNKKNLFDRERAKFTTFLDKKLFTPEEHASRIQTSDTTLNNIEILDTQSFLGGSPIDFLGGDTGGGGFENMWGGDSDTTERRRHVDMSNERMHETGVWWKDILYAPFFLVLYVFKSLIYDFPTKDEWKSILQAIQKVSAVTGGISAILWLLGFTFIFSLSFQTIAAGLMFGLATSTLKVLSKGEGTGEGTEADADLNMFGEASPSSMNFDFSALNVEDNALDLDGAELTMGGGGGGFDFANLFQTPNADTMVETVDTGRYKVLAPSPIGVKSNEEFERTLMQVFTENERYRGVEIHDRKELIESLHGYVVTNDKGFGSWSVATPRSTEYNHVAYALFKGLGQIQNSFLTDDEVMIISSIKSNPLIYKIEVELPNYFKSSQIQSKIKEIEDALRKGESDAEVQVMVSYYQGIFVFKFMRLDNTSMVSLGDILRFYDEDTGTTALDAYADKKMGLPMLLGLLNNEYPYIVDLEENSSGVIIGGSGSGKSWFTFLLLINFILTTDYSNIGFVVLDKKNAAFWNQFARFPHVLGYHTEIENYLEQLRELYQELTRRKAMLVQINEENLKGYRQRLRENNEYEKLKEVPNLVIIIDEITSTMQDLETYYKERDEEQYFKEVRGLLAMISQEGRSLGVRIISIGQRSIDSSVPKNVMANSSFKFAMKMDAESDFEIMMGKEITTMSKPQTKGIGIAKTMGGGLQTIKTLTVGGASEYQVVRLIRVLALEWVRRADGVSDILNPPPFINMPKCYNRNKFVQESLKDIEEWRILSPSEVTPYRGNANSAPSMPFGGGYTAPPVAVGTANIPAYTEPFTDYGATTQDVPRYEDTFADEFVVSPEVPVVSPPIAGQVEMPAFGEWLTPPNGEGTGEGASLYDTTAFDIPLFDSQAVNLPDGGQSFEVFPLTPPQQEAEAEGATDVSETRNVSLQDFEKMMQNKPDESLTSTQKMKVRIQIFGHILNFGEKVTNQGILQSRMHRDVLMDKFSTSELSEAKAHTNIMVDGDYYFAWRTAPK